MNQYIWTRYTIVNTCKVDNAVTKSIFKFVIIYPPEIYLDFPDHVKYV